MTIGSLPPPSNLGGILGGIASSQRVTSTVIAAATEEFQLNTFHQAARNLTETGQNNIRILRGWAKSKGWEKFPSPNGAPEVWGTYEDGSFLRRLKIKPVSSLRPGLKQGSNIPRFDAKLGDGLFINPFTSQRGGREIGTHLMLETIYLK